MWCLQPCYRGNRLSVSWYQAVSEKYVWKHIFACALFVLSVSPFSPVCPDSGSSPPVRIVYPTTPVAVSVQRSQPLTLECVVSGGPAPAAKWFKNGKEVTPGPFHHLQHTNLAFVAVATSDAGTYSCAAEAGQGPIISASYTVNVLGKNRR